MRVGTFNINRNLSIGDRQACIALACEKTDICGLQEIQPHQEHQISGLLRDYGFGMVGLYKQRIIYRMSAAELLLHIPGAPALRTYDSKLFHPRISKATPARGFTFGCFRDLSGTCFSEFLKFDDTHLINGAWNRRKLPLKFLRPGIWHTELAELYEHLNNGVELYDGFAHVLVGDFNKRKVRAPQYYRWATGETIDKIAVNGLTIEGVTSYPTPSDHRLRVAAVA